MKPDSVSGMRPDIVLVKNLDSSLGMHMDIVVDSSPGMNLDIVSGMLPDTSGV